MTDERDGAPPIHSASVRFFETQFERQVRENDFALNPFETLALDYLAGDLLDLGCGLGNLSLEAARRGCRVTAMDGSPTAIRRIREAAHRESLPVTALLADLERYVVDRDYDTIVAIGLLMFMRREPALALLAQIQERVRPGGRAIVNVLVEGTTYHDMFDPDHHYLFGPEELRERFAGWNVLVWRPETFPAPRGTIKAFTTIVAEKPGGRGGAAPPWGGRKRVFSRSGGSSPSGSSRPPRGCPALRAQPRPGRSR